MTMTGPNQRKRIPPQPAMLLLGFALLLCAPIAAAQNNLGELLDAGAKILSLEDFKEQLVQRMLVGPTATGGTLEVIYTATGTVEGSGSASTLMGTTQAGIGMLRVSGEWTIDTSGRVCTSMRMSGPGTGIAISTMLPPRCQSWFKLGERYYLSDSDTDRHAKVLPRTIKK